MSDTEGRERVSIRVEREEKRAREVNLLSRKILSTPRVSS